MEEKGRSRAGRLTLSMWVYAVERRESSGDAVDDESEGEESERVG